MMQGGINNAALFGASQRSARSKLDQMAGIKRPSGILASSSELIQAAMPARPPMPPVMQQSPASMVGAPMVPPPMPAAAMMPMPTTVAPRPLNPMAGNPTAGQPVVQLNEGGFLDRVKESVNKIPGKMAEAGMFRNLPPETTQALDITMEPGRFRSFLDSLNPLSMKFLTENIGDEDAIAQAAQKKLNNIEAAAKSKDPAQTADQVMVEAGEQPTDAAKIDFAENVFGLEDVNDIDEINRRIANVAIGSSVAKSPDEFAQAVLLGLQTFKQTASARAAAGSGGSSFTKDRTALRAYQDTLDSLTRSLSDRDLPDGYEGTVADYAAEQALKQVLQTYPTNQIPPQLLNQAGGQPRRPETPAGGLETFLIEAQKINPDSSVEELTEFYTKKYGG